MPSVEEALKISQDFLEFAKEVRANNAIKEQQEEEKIVLKVKANCQCVRIFSSTQTFRDFALDFLPCNNTDFMFTYQALYHKF